MIQYSVIHSIDSFPRWEEILAVALGLANEFSVVFPNGDYDPENPLVNGKPEFEALPDLKAERWPNMENSTILFGRLNDSVRKIILAFNNQHPDKDSSYLWHYSLYRNGIELMNVQDFTVCLLDLDTELTDSLDSLQIQWRDD